MNFKTAMPGHGETFIQCQLKSWNILLIGWICYFYSHVGTH